MTHIIIQLVSRFIILSTIAAANTVNANPIKLEKINESYNKNVTISGPVRAGVMYSSSSPNVNPDQLWIDISSLNDISSGDSKVGQKLCVNMLSADGQYSASFNYQLTGNNNDSDSTEPFKVPTSYSGVVEKYAPNQLAVLAEVKPDCIGENQGKTKQIIPVTWGTRDKPNTLHVYLNSRSSKTYLKLYSTEGGSEKIACDPVKFETTTAYNMECNISNISNYNLEKTKIIRTNFGNRFKIIKLPISISPGGS